MRMKILLGGKHLAAAHVRMVMHLNFILNETFNKTCTNEKKADVFRPNYSI